MRNGCTFLLALALPVFGQFQNNTEAKLSCENQKNHGGDRQERSCEMRESRLPVTQRLDIDSAPNGGVSVRGWDKNEIFVRARVEASAESEAEAKSIAQQVQVQTAGGRIRATGPDTQRRRWWSVSYEVFVPHRIDLTVETVNGGVNASDVEGRLEFRTVNGGLNLTRIAGDVKGRTTNGGVNVDLEGPSWRGVGLDAETTNGGVNLRVPANYSARVSSRTMNGSMNTDFPVTFQGEIGGRNKNIDFNIGGGGAPIRVTTQNGGVNIRKKSI